jgi:hypothetical protein
MQQRPGGLREGPTPYGAAMPSTPYPSPFLVAEARALFSRSIEPYDFVNWARRQGGQYRAEPWAILASLLPPELLAHRSIVYSIQRAGVTVAAIAQQRTDCPDKLRQALERTRSALVSSILAERDVQDVDGMLAVLARPILPSFSGDPWPDGCPVNTFPDGSMTLVEVANQYASLGPELIRHPSATLPVYRAVATHPAVLGSDVAKEIGRFPELLDDPVIWDALLEGSRTWLTDVVFDCLRFHQSREMAARWFVQSLRLDPAMALKHVADLQTRGDLRAEHLVLALEDVDPEVRAGAIQILAVVAPGAPSPVTLPTTSAPAPPQSTGLGR